MPRTVNRDRGFFGEALVELRIQSGLTQQQLADLTGIQQAQLAQYESGKKKSPNLDTIVAIADALGVPPAELLSLYEGSKTKARKRPKAIA